MNVNDMEVVRSILKSNDYVETNDLLAVSWLFGLYRDLFSFWWMLLSKAYTNKILPFQADVVVLITCSIREGAEDKVWRELKRIRHVARRKPVVGVLGMFCRLRSIFLLISVSNAIIVP